MRTTLSESSLQAHIGNRRAQGSWGVSSSTFTELPRVEVFVPRKSDYDLVQGRTSRAAGRHAPHMVIHQRLLSVQSAPTRKTRKVFLRKSDDCRAAHRAVSPRESAEFVALGTYALTQNLRRLRFREEDLWNRYPEETNAPYGWPEDDAGASAKLSRSMASTLFPVARKLYGPATISIQNVSVISSSHSQMVEP